MRFLILIFFISCKVENIETVDVNFFDLKHDFSCKINKEMNDSANCGGCGPCPTGINRRFGNSYLFHCCNGVCVDAQTDNKNCGSCGMVCLGDTQRCFDWQCGGLN